MEAASHTSQTEGSAGCPLGPRGQPAQSSFCVFSGRKEARNQGIWVGWGEKAMSQSLVPLCKRIRYNICRLSPWISNTPVVLSVGGRRGRSSSGGFRAGEPISELPGNFSNYTRKEDTYIHQNFQNPALREPLFLPVGTQVPCPLWGVREKVFKVSVPPSLRTHSRTVAQR